MNDDYLWDRSGKPDAEVERLENLLRRFRQDAPAPDFAHAAVEPERSGPAWWRWPRLAIAAASFAALSFLAWYAIRATRPAWTVERLAGTPAVGSLTIRAPGHLLAGESLETDANSRARINMEAVGEVEVDPNTRLRLLRARPLEHRFALDRGTIHAFIWAPPRLFTVDTPSAVAVDLGCRYTLHVEPGGNGELHVTFGWVSFDHTVNGATVESFVPAGAMCLTRPGAGPGTPYFEDASPALRAALEKLDFDLVAGGVKGGIPGGVQGGVSGGVTGGISGGVTGGVSEGVTGGVESLEKVRAAVLDTVLSESRRQDALTLWHLLSRTAGAERARVYERLAQLVPPPAGVTRQGILEGDPATQRNMRDLWWDELGLGDTSWWRIWKGPAPVR